MGAQEIAKLSAAAADARFHRAERHSLDLGDLLVIQTMDIMEENGRSLLDWQRQQAGLKQLAEFAALRGALRVLGGVCRSHQRRRIVLQDVVEGVRGPAPPAAVLVVAGVDSYAKEPGAESAAAVRRQGLIRGEKRLLRGIFRCRRLAEHPEAETVHLILVSLYQAVEGGRVATSSTGSQIVIVHRTAGFLDGAARGPYTGR